MAEVTIGVPVYNGADLIAECLECLTCQTFTDIEILVFDNASTDRTQEIVESFAARDHRIKYTRRSENVGPVKNFAEPLALATSPYFMWRAHDDLSSLDYVEKLLAALKANPKATLATGTIQFERRKAERTRRYIPEIPRGGQIPSILKLMFSSRSSWYYGLWRTQTLRPLIRRIWTEFPYAWASDHLTIYPLLLDRRVVAVPEVTFVQRVTRKLDGPQVTIRQPVSELLEIRRAFLRCCDKMVDESQVGLLARIAVKTANRFYVDKRVYPMWKIVRRSLLRR